MILVFPDIDTFRLALTGGVVPPEVLSAEAQVAFGADGKLSVETDAKLTRKSATELTRLGVTLAKRHIGSVEAISCWPQILPTTRDPNPPQLSSQAPVLFELESAEDLPAIVGEMLRLGNDRQSVRWLADDRDDRRVLLRVVGPPYYTLLRALDQTASGTRGAVRAYVEQAPRVWVQVGHSHELAAKVKLDEGQILLVRPPREWTYLPDAPFRDVYEVLQFQLPAGPHDWSAEPVAEKMTVPLRLTAGNAADTPELWVLRGDAANQLDAFVRDADERLTQRLKFAVATAPAGETVIVLRVTASKLAPPVLPLADSVGFKPYYKLPNLYLPAGTRLHPTLRRDAVRKLLADDTDRLVWLYPGPDGAFTPETLPEDSFRPLEDWVDYVIATNHAPLAAWVEATRFDFEHFVCNEAGKPPRDPGDGKGRRRTRADAGDTPLTTTAPAKAVKKSPDPGDRPPTQAFAARVEARKPSEWEVRRRELQDEFLRHDGPLDMPERQALWPELAVANVGANDRSEATLCWVNALWGRDTAPREWAEGWLRTELPDLDLPVTAAAFDRMMKPPDPQAPQVRQFAALLFWLTQQQPVPGWLAARLPAIKRYLEAHERSLPTRAAWLVASRLAVLTGADTLGLARVRDRLLQRLLEEGIVAERDLPFFLRSAGLKDSDRLSRVRAGVIELHQAVRTWAETSLKMPQPSVPPNHDQGATLGYIDLMFAFALAKLGEAGAARQRIESARQVLEGFQPSGDRGIAARFLLLALKYRVEQALAGKPHAGLLDRPLIEALEAIHAQGKGQPNNPFGLAHYVITRFQQKSRILEPQEKLDPYAAYMVHGDELKKALAGLARIKDPNALARTVRELYRSGVDGRPAAEARFAVLLDALPLSARVGEQFSLELVGLVPEVMKASAAVGLAISELSVKQGQLLEQALFLAAHFDRKEVVQHLVDEFIELLRVKPPEQQFELINVVASQCLRSLRRLQLRDEIDKLLRRMQEVVLGGQDVGKLRQLHRAKGAKSASRTDLWGKTLRSLLHLAGGWLTFGLTDQAARILDEARAELLGPDATPFPPQEYTLLAQAYVGALGHGPADVGLLRVVELFAAMAPGRVVNAFTSAKFYSRFHLNLVEDTVLAVVNEDFALGPAGRRWLDEDEHLVRRRIHRDMKHALAGL